MNGGDGAAHQEKVTPSRSGGAAAALHRCTSRGYLWCKPQLRRCAGMGV